MNSTIMMREFKIKNRMMTVVFVVVLFQLLLGGAGIWGMTRVQASSEFAAALSVDSLKGIDLLRSEMAKVRLLEKEMIILYEFPDRVKNSHQKWEVGVNAINKLIEKFSIGRSEAEQAVAKNLSSRISAYKKRLEPIIKNLEESIFDSATAAYKLSGSAAVEFVEADKLLVQLGEGVALALQASTLEQQQVAFQMQLIFAVLLTVGLVLIVPTSWVNMISICKPLKLVRLNTIAMAKGDLTQKIEIFGRDEMTDLQISLDNMQGGIAYIVAQVRGSSELISSASQEIAAGNHDLSMRTEQTAKNLQITASAISHLLENVQSTAASAQTANGLAASVSNSAQNCGRVVEQAVLSMQDIAKSSKKINDIIGLIDSIAFQTNILALNAAVEAARAGEQGRGFAVVASEVRALAQRSANAAHEIKVLIMTSVDAVDGGVRLVEQAGTAMRSIVTNAKQVNDIVKEISVASAQQSEGIVQLNQSVHEIDDMTQQNTALVEQSAAAAASLSEQAITLTTVVRQFHTA